jgi:hypothetical protein
MDIPPSLQTTAQAVASLFAWSEDEAKSNITVMQCELVARGSNVPVLVVSIPSKSVTASSRKRKAGGGMITVQPIGSFQDFHDGREGKPCCRCRHNASEEHTRYHGTSKLLGLMEDGFKLKPSGKPDRALGPNPGFFHYAAEQWSKAFGYSGPQTLGEGRQQTPHLRVVCIIQTMCWNVCNGRDWGMTHADCGRYAITSLRIVRDDHCKGIANWYDCEEVEEKNLSNSFQSISVRSTPVHSNPVRPGYLHSPPPPASSRDSHRFHTTPHRQT